MKINKEDNAIYRVMDGKIERLDSPPTGHGTVTIRWQDGKPYIYEVKYTKK